MGGRSEGLARLFGLAVVLVAAAVLVWAVVLQESGRRDPLEPSRRALTTRESDAVLRALERARAEGDAEGVAAYEEMWRNIQRNAEEKRLAGQRG